MPKDPTKHRSVAKEPKRAGSFKVAKDWFGEVRQYLLTLVLVVAAFFAFKTVLIQKLGWPEWSIALAFVPPALVFAFRTLPSLMQQWHEDRFIKIAAGSTVSGGGSYFLIRPYGEEERTRYARADGMHTTVLDWCRKTNESILVLTGLSGTGKSSLLNAFVIPALREGKSASTVFLVRSFDNPIDELRKQLLSPGLVWDNPPDGNTESNLLELFRKAITRLRRGKNDAKIFVVFDQFEELIVLHKDDSPAATGIREFLTQLQQTELPGVVVILSVRYDYRIFLERLAVPPLNLGKNWQDVPAFTFADSMLFIKAPESRLDIAPRRLRHILTEAAAVDGTRGLIRPIVLNMVGLVLTRIAESPRAELPTRTLLANDLRTYINQSERRRISRLILPEMLTDADTKSPKSIGELETATGLKPQLILGFLQDLELDGYVRQISHEPNIVDRIWEISHDFVARLLGPIVRRRFETLWGTTLKVMYPALLAAWVLALGALFIAAPWLRRQRAEEILRDRFSMFLHDQGDGYLASEQNGNFTDLRGAVNELINFGSITELNLYYCSQLTDVDGLKGLTALKSLNLQGCSQLTNVDGLKGLTALKILVLAGCSKLTNVDGLKGLTALQNLNLASCSQLTNVDALKGLTALQNLDLPACSELTNVDGLKGLTALQNLALAGCSKLTDVDGLKGLTALQYLRLAGCSKLTNVDGLKGLTALKSLDLGGCSKLTNVDGLKGLTALQILDLEYCSQLTNVDGLKGLTALQYLSLAGCSKLTNVDGLKGLTALQNLGLQGCSQLTNVDGLKGLTALQSLVLEGCSQLTNVDGLKGLTALQSLDVTRSSVSPDEIAALKRALPSTHISQ